MCGIRLRSWLGLAWIFVWVVFSNSPAALGDDLPLVLSLRSKANVIKTTVREYSDFYARVTLQNEKDYIQKWKISGHVGKISDGKVKVKLSVDYTDSGDYHDAAKADDTLRINVNENKYMGGASASTFGDIPIRCLWLRRGTDPMPYLLEGLKQRDDRFFGSAASLSWMGPDAAPAVPLLVEALRSDKSDVRMVALDTLGSIGAKAAAALPRLRELIKGNDKGLSMEASEVVIPQIETDVEKQKHR